MTQDRPPSLHWSRHARQWSRVGQTLRPGPEDIAHYTQTLMALRATLPGAVLHRALLLGVTPEIAGLPWPEETFLTAIDLALPMIENVWPGNDARRGAVRADWLAMPFADTRFDFIVGDGCLALLDYPQDWRRFAGELRRCLRYDGACILRTFCRPPSGDDTRVADVAAALRAGRISSFHAFKWRLAMALQGDDTARGIALVDIHKAFQAMIPRRTALAEKLGWPLAEIDSIDAYRENPARLHFPTLDEIRAVFVADFETSTHRAGHYELAECCPHLLLRPHRD